ncbi:MAG TPA: hypothetical protein PLG99_09830, partial [Kaistiaceae bacterium]|nr:hypothetical protein [Kaistiaceae bacterium]
MQDPILMIEAGMHVGVIRRAGVDEDRSLLVTGSDDKTVRVWSLPGGRLQRVLRVPIGPGEAGEVRAVAISPNGMLVAAAGWDAYYDVGQTNYVYVFNTATGAMVGRLGPLPNVIHELEFSPDGYYLVAGLGNENGIRVWDIASRRETYADKDYGGDVYGIAWAADGRLATTSYDGKVRLYSPELKLVKSAKTKGGVNPSGIAFSPDGNEIAVGFIDTAAVDILSAKDLTRQARPDTKKVTNGNVASVAWSSDGQTLYAAGRWRTNDETPVVAWSKRGRGPMKRIGGTSDTVMDLIGGAGGDLVYGAADPQIGYFEGQTQHIWRDRVTADMRVKLDENFLISSDAQRVRFGLNFGIDEPYLFDIGMLSFNQAPKAPRDMHQPDTTKLKVADWRHNGSPKVAGKPLEIARYEWSRSVAVLPDASGLVLGSDFSVARFDREANKEWTIPVPGA